MATRVCPNCGSQYVASVRRCIDCEIVLVDVEVEGGTSSTVEASSGDQIAYELEGWGNQLRQSLAGMLDLAEIPFVWEAGTLVVPAPFEEQVDRCIAAVEGTEAPELDEDAELVAFEIEAITLEELDLLDGLLLAQGVAHAWSEDGELLVAEADEATVAELIDGLLDTEDDDDGTDGLALHEALTALYVAVDKLMKDTGDAKLVARFADAAEGLDGLGLPYGMAEADWDAVLAQVAELRAALLGGDEAEPEDEEPADDEGTEDDEVEDEATEADEAEDEADDDGAEDDEADDEADDDPDPDDGPATPGELARALRERLRDLV